MKAIIDSRRLILAMFTTLLLAWGAMLVHAYMPSSFPEMVAESRFIARVQGIKAGEDWAIYKVLKVLKGAELMTNNPSGEIKIIEVTPPPGNFRSYDAMFRMQQTNEVVIAFLHPWRKETNTFRPVDFGKFTTYPNDQRDPVQLQRTVERMVELALIPDPKERFKALLPLVDSVDSTEKSFARDCLIGIACGRKDPQEYKETILGFLTDGNPEHGSMALTMLQEHKVPEAISNLLKFTHDPSPNIASRASLALRHYQTPEVEARLIELTRHTNASVRAQTVVSLREFKSPAVDQAIRERINDPDDHVRSLALQQARPAPAAEGVAYQARLLNLLTNDPGFETRAAAAKQLAESGNTNVLQTIIDQVRIHSGQDRYRFLLMMTLEPVLRKQQELIRKNEPVFIDTLTDRSGSAHFALGILAVSDTSTGWKAIEDFSKTNSNSMHRGTAEWYLKQRK